MRCNSRRVPWPWRRPSKVPLGRPLHRALPRRAPARGPRPSGPRWRPVWKSKFHGAFVPNRVHPTHWLISTQVAAVVAWKNWRIAFVVVAASTALFLAPAAAVFRYADRWRREADKATALTASRRLKHLCATAFCYACGWEVPFVHLVSYAEDAGHTPSRAAGVVIAIGVGGSAGRIVSARCADAIGAPRVFSALILATCAADLVLPWVIRHASALYVYGAVAGTTAGGLIALTTPMARTCLADTAGLPQASGAVYSSMAPGVVAGPVLVGLIRDRVGSYAWGFRGAAGCWAVAFALCLTLPRQPPARPTGVS